MFSCSAVSSLKLKLLCLRHYRDFPKLNTTVWIAEVAELAEILAEMRHHPYVHVTDETENSVSFTAIPG